MKKLILAFILITNYSFAQNFVSNFNGTTSNIDLGPSIGTGVRTICLWFKPNVTITSSTPLTNALVYRDDNSNIDEYGLQLVGTDQGGGYEGHLLFSFRATLSTVYLTQSTSTTWLSTDWHHTCGTIDAIAGMKLYIDGNIEDINTSWTSAIPFATEITALGTWGDEGIRYLNGRLEEVVLWNRALSASEVSAKMCTPLNIATETGLVAYYKMNEGSGFTAIDQTGSFNGTVNGSTWIIDSTCVDFISVNEIEHKSSLVSIYPNPTQESINFNLSALERGNYSLEITDVTGKIVLQKTVVVYNGNTITTNIDNIVKGAYFIRISNENLTHIGTFIKQ